MLTTINKQRLFSQILSTLPRHMEVRDRDTSQGTPRLVLEEFIYALCREGTTQELADRGFNNLREIFFDWNEVRVSSLREVADALEGLAQPEGRAQRVLAFLQEVFETTFSFDLESLHKKGVKEAARKLARYQGANDFAIAWVLQHSLGGHAMPLDVPVLRVLRRLGLLDSDLADLEALRTSLEHQVPKAKGSIFVELLSQLADGYCSEDEPECEQCPLSNSCPSAATRPTNEVQSRPKSR